MAATTISGDVATDLVNQSQRVVDMDNEIQQWEPTNAPFVALLGRLPETPAKSPKVEWLEVQSMPRFTTVTASASAGATVYAIASSTSGYFRVGDGIRNTENGVFSEVTGVSSTSIGLSAPIGGTAAASCTSAAGIYIVNNANAEGASIRAIRTVKLDNQSNYAEIIRTPFGVTKTVVASDFYGQWANERARLNFQSGMEHDRQIEATYFWGAKSENTSTAGSPKRYCGGLFEFIVSNITPATTLTRAAFETFLRGGFRYGSEEKYLFAGPLVCAALDGFIWNSSASSNGNSMRQNLPTPARETGVVLTTYYSSQGTVHIVMKRHWNDSADLRGTAFLVDMANVKKRDLRATRVNENIQAPDADKYEDEYLTETSLEVAVEASHARLYGVTG